MVGKVTTLDLTDQRVRQLADRNHRPEEIWSIGGFLLSVHCETCHQPWPCPTRVALDQPAAPSIPSESRSNP